ncbi:MAG: class I SAM-dependent methyltransferase [Microthrixaceae bacterium]|nr:class I SAM-dependent methyltransferase [Acidimicrobiales bacterium]MCB9403227.1 class I SAM-dependent methyltransferase [Microthrixaceae bacterium]
MTESGDDASSTLFEVLERSRSLGFLGPGPIETHVSHALVFGRATAGAPSRALDLGAGGGLPGLVLLCEMWPSTEWVFVDSQQKRTTFLSESVEVLGQSDRVTVVTERAELVGRDPKFRGGFDLVVARSFAAPAVTAECAAPLLRPGGLLLVSDPPDGPADRWPGNRLSLAGLEPMDTVVEDGVHLSVLKRDDSAIDRLPRRVGIPSKRPLW